MLNFPLSPFFQAQISPYSYYNRGKDPAPAKTEDKVELHSEQKVNHKPRICKMVKGPNGFGFSLNMAKNKPGLFINEVLMQDDAQQKAWVVCRAVSSLPWCKFIQEMPQKRQVSSSSSLGYDL